jgi:hypothetical protein
MRPKEEKKKPIKINDSRTLDESGFKATFGSTG